MLIAKTNTHVQARMIITAHEIRIVLVLFVMTLSCDASQMVRRLNILCEHTRFSGEIVEIHWKLSLQFHSGHIFGTAVQLDNVRTSRWRRVDTGVDESIL